MKYTIDLKIGNRKRIFSGSTIEETAEKAAREFIHHMDGLIDKTNRGLPRSRFNPTRPLIGLEYDRNKYKSDVKKLLIKTIKEKESEISQ